MFGGLRAKAHASLVRIQGREMIDCIGRLQSQDSDEVAAILAVAMHYRNSMLSELKMDLMYPLVAIQQDHRLADRLNRDLQEVQREKLFSLGSAIIVWLCTIRAAQEPALRSLGRDLWRQLARGFPHVHEAAASLGQISGVTINTSHAGRFPDGFAPDSL
jgi:hypothetical protein